MAASARASTTESERPTSTNGNGHRGVIELARLAVEDTIRLVQQEIQLAKIEVQEMLKSNIQAAILLGVAAVFGLLFVVMLFVFIALLLPPHALVAAIEAVAFLIVAVVLGLVGKGRLKTKPLPKTMTTLKEDAEWAKQVLKRNGK